MNEQLVECKTKMIEQKNPRYNASRSESSVAEHSQLASNLCGNKVPRIKELSRHV